jgi:hypothetical protein
MKEENLEEKLPVLTEAYHKAKSERTLRINTSIQMYREKVLYAGVGTAVFAGTALCALYYFMAQ